MTLSPSRASTLLPLLVASALALTSASAAFAADKPGTPRPMWQSSQRDGPFIQVLTHLSVFSDSDDGPLLASVFGYGLRGGYRWKRWGLFGVFEHDMWLGLEKESSVKLGAFNLGVGGELLYAGGFVRTALAGGLSILAENTALDKAGTTGIFFDLRPVGLRFMIHPRWVLGLDPLSFALVMPVLGGIPLTQVEYRTTLYVELRL